jgi:hypothetical protein
MFRKQRSQLRRQGVPTFGMVRNVGKAAMRSFPKWHRPEYKFISATEFGRSSDIAVMAQSQRNVVIPVALGAK